jgi:hypothetical protein
MTVADLEDRLTAAEFEEWAAFYQLEPFGEERAELRNAWLIYAVATMLGAKDISLADCMMKFDADTQDEIERAIPQSQWTPDMWQRWVNMYFGILAGQGKAVRLS